MIILFCAQCNKPLAEIWSPWISNSKALGLDAQKDNLCFQCFSWPLCCEFCDVVSCRCCIKCGRVTCLCVFFCFGGDTFPKYHPLNTSLAAPTFTSAANPPMLLFLVPFPIHCRVRPQPHLLRSSNVLSICTPVAASTPVTVVICDGKCASWSPSSPLYWVHLEGSCCSTWTSSYEDFLGPSGIKANENLGMHKISIVWLKEDS